MRRDRKCQLLISLTDNHSSDSTWSASFSLSAISEGGRAGGLPKNTRKKVRSLRRIRRGPATKRVLISGEKDSREPPAWSRARECRPASNKILLQLDALHGAGRDFTFCFPSLFRFSKRFSYSFHEQFIHTILYLPKIACDVAIFVIKIAQKILKVNLS